MRKLNRDKRSSIIHALCEGNSINATARLCGVSKLTVLRLLADVGMLCRDYHDLTVRGLQARRIQVDEVWSFVGCKQRSKERGKQGLGDIWAWIALDADSKLVVSYMLGRRDAWTGSEFMWDVADRIDVRVQLTSDGHRSYLEAVPHAFGDEIDFAVLVKLYGYEQPDHSRYSPPKCIGARRRAISGDPDPDHISTSYIERQNLSLRMGCRRYTRLTNAFSKKLENHQHAIALHYWFYNFSRKHQTLGMTPAVVAGIADQPMAISGLVALLETEERLLAGGGRLNRADRT